MATTSETGQMRCRVCKYVYDPAVGDARGGIEPGVAFDDLADTWVCPKCRAAKIRFSPAV